MNPANAKPQKAPPNSYPPPGLPASVRNVLLEAANDTQELIGPQSRGGSEHGVHSRVIRKERNLASKAPAKPASRSGAKTKSSLEQLFREQLEESATPTSATPVVARHAERPPRAAADERGRKATAPPPPPPLPDSLRRALLRPDGPLVPLIELESDECSPVESGLLSMAPRVDIYENEYCMLILADVPGVDDADISLAVEGTTMTLAAVRAGDSEGATTRSRGTATPNYKRSFAIPRGVELENIDAALHDGVLRIRVPKMAAPPRRIAVNRRPK